MNAAAGPDVAWADTNLFVALFADRAHPLHDRAVQLFQRVTDGALRLIVTPVVVAELVYVAERLFEWRRSTTANRVGQLLRADGLEVREAEALGRALELYGGQRRLDFADAYLAGSALAVGPASVASLDRDFDRVTGVRRVS